MIKGIIFDMDGVLIDAKDWHYEALNRALRLFGYEISRLAHLALFDGLPTRKKLEILSKQTNLPPALHALINELKQQYTMEMIYTQCKPSFNHEYALSGLKAEGYQLAVASNSIKHTIEVMLQKANLLHYFDSIISNEDVIHPKPHPEIYEKAIQQMCLAPDECLVIEDNENGIQAARAAGIQVLIVKETKEVTYHMLKKYIENAEIYA